MKEKNYLCVNSTTQRCSKKIIKSFLTEDFFNLPPMSTTPEVLLELRLSPGKFLKKIRNGPYGILMGLGETVPKKSLKSKIS
jgi:hypothetical protein